MTTINEVVEALRRRIDNDMIDLSTVMPTGRRAAIAFVERYGDELEMMLGRRPVVIRSTSVPSGRGAFGRYKGGARSKAASVRVQWQQR